MDYTENLLNRLITDTQLMLDHYKKLRANENVLEPSDTFFIKRIRTWATQMGSAHGHLAEFKMYFKSRVIKGRVIESGAKKGDVVIGLKDSSYGRTVQSKSIVSKDKTSVTNALRDAVVQLAGLKHEKPRPNDSYVIQLEIGNPKNPWPATPTTVKQQVDALRKSVCLEVVNAVKSASMLWASNANNTLFHVFTHPGFESLNNIGPKSTKLSSNAGFDTHSFYDPARDQHVSISKPKYRLTPTFIVKIVWSSRREVVGVANGIGGFVVRVKTGGLDPFTAEIIKVYP